MPRKRGGAFAGKEVRHFRLVTRPQGDAYANDPDAPGMVLEPMVTKTLMRQTGLDEEELLKVPEYLASKMPEVFADPDAALRSLEQSMVGEDLGRADRDLEGDCYFPKDGYNYEQHLKKCSGGKAGGVVGAVVEATQKVDEVEIKKQAAETTEEAEVLRALECMDEYEELEDGVIEELLPGGVVDADTVLWGPTAFEDRDLPDLAVFKEMHGSRMGALLAGLDDDREDDTKSVATNASTMSRRDQATMAATAQFEEFFTAEYLDDDAIGDCEDDEIEGELDEEECEKIADEYIAEKKLEHDEMVSIVDPRHGKLDTVPRVINETRAIIERHYSEGKEDDTSSGEEEDTDESRHWDCETFLSGLSNLSNRPAKIDKAKIKKNVVMKPVKEQDEGESSEDDVVELPDVCLERPKGETSEEKRIRKSGVKEMRRICRKMKKESKDTYKAEAEKLKARDVGTNDVKQGLRKLRL